VFASVWFIAKALGLGLVSKFAFCKRQSIYYGTAASAIALFLRASKCEDLLKYFIHLFLLVGFLDHCLGKWSQNCVYKISHGFATLFHVVGSRPDDNALNSHVGWKFD
jgi:hypothetical protein